MSEIAINAYLQEIEKLQFRGGTKNESSVRVAFQKLLSTYAKVKDLELVAELAIKSKYGNTIRPDGTLKDNLRQDWGYWESKDEADDIDAEIAKKFAKGYPDDNIIFEDTLTAVLFQNGMEVIRTPVREVEKLDYVLKKFVDYERPEVRDFRKAIELFKADIPKVTEALRESIEKNAEMNDAYIAARNTFLELCRDVINPAITPADIREMVIQHILTADIFNTIFDEPHFHSENNIASELEKLTNTFFTRDVRRKTLARIKHYYDAINARAAQIADHHEKQRFLKVVYETFYKSYNPKKADRLGVVYTPNEIVRFMVESTDYLLQKHFGKRLQDKGVNILDPATGTGTFICDIIDHIRSDKLEYKYKHELHANEVEILPYYIANLNIEFTYKQKTGRYAEFDNLCFVDTLDNYVNVNKDAVMDIFSLSDENSERIKRQNESKISVIIGNPPYNANQMNENENNKNREYPAVDKRIKDTYIKESTAQKTKVYDMYSRFYRWAMDRLNENGIIAFITNRSFIDSRTFDGFRKTVMNEFDYAYIIDTKSDVRQNPKIAGTTHNVFGIQTGVAVMLLVKQKERENKTCRILYTAMEDEWRKEDKLQWFTEHKLASVNLEALQPDKNNNWINLVENDWDEMIPVADKAVKNRKGIKAIFQIYSTGLSTNRDEWVIDSSNTTLANKMQHFVSCYDAIEDVNSQTIKWSRNLKVRFKNRLKEQFDNNRIVEYNYRPYFKTCLYHSEVFIDEHGLSAQIFSDVNTVICFSTKSLVYLVANALYDLHFVGDTQSLPLYRYDQNATRHDNITDWALTLFREHYQNESITKEDIFHYVYGVLHNPAYRTKYEINLKRSLPRVPFYADFALWAGWGKELMDLHLNYETVEPYPLNIVTCEPDAGALNKARLKADKNSGTIILDNITSLSGIPHTAWDYKLGNRSALEWILDQYKEKKPKDPTIAKLFNTYRFADYKDKVIDLLMRVCTVSVKTMEIVGKMEVKN